MYENLRTERTLKTEYALNHECETNRSVDTPTDRRRERSFISRR